MDVNDVLEKPVVTEKSTFLREKGQYTFLISLRANKAMVKQAVETLFKVKVKDVHVLHQKPKRKSIRMSRKVGKTVRRKKAIVCLEKNAKIPDLDV